MCGRSEVEEINLTFHLAPDSARWTPRLDRVRVFLFILSSFAGSLFGGGCKKDGKKGTALTCEPGHLPPECTLGLGFCLFKTLNSLLRIDFRFAE